MTGRSGAMWPTGRQRAREPLSAQEVFDRRGLEPHAEGGGWTRVSCAAPAFSVDGLERAAADLVPGG